MMTLELNDEQHRLVAGLVEGRIGELHSEVRRSRTYTWRDELKHELETLRGLHEKLTAAPQGTAAP